MAKGSSGFDSGNHYSVGETKTLNGYKITDGNVETPSGRSQYIDKYEELPESEKKRMKAALEKAGISDPVLSGRAIIPRNVAEAAIKQIAMKKEALAKNVPGLEELRDARAYDYRQRSEFNRSVERGSGIIKGNPNSNTAASVAKAYPRAAAYLKAESFYNSNNYVKSSYGKEAMNKIVNGKNASSAIKEMEKKWGDYAKKKAMTD